MTLVRIATALLAGAVLAAAPAGAVSPRYWIDNAAEDFLAGEANGTSITSDGSLTLAPEVTVLAEPEVAYVWDVAAANGSVYLGTGDDGWVLRVRGGKTEQFFQCAALEVLSVLVTADGTVWAGTAPEGFVYRIDPDTGAGSIAYDAQEAYVWDMLESPDGSIVLALGPDAKVARLDPGSGEAETLAEIDDNHVVCLAWEDEGNLLLGTEGKGLVARLGPDGRIRVLYDTPQGEVAAVLAGPGGEVWAAAAGTSESREFANESMPDTNGDGSGIENSMDFSFEFTPSGVDDGVLYRIDPAGNAIRHWESGEVAILDLAWNTGRTAVLAATGERGRLYSIADDGGATLVLDSEEAFLVALERQDDALLVATANPARLKRVATGYAKSGAYDSQVLDARRVARWGRIDWQGEAGGGVQLSVRTGNTEEPDNTWSDWKQVGKDGRLDVFGERFLQWRAELAGGGDRTPVVRRVRVSSLENNLAPRVIAVGVAPAGTGFFDEIPEPRPRPLYQALPGGVNVQYSLDNGENEFPPEVRAPWTRGLRLVRWEAIDPNEDFLLFELYFRRDDEAEWKRFAEEVEGETFSFNSQGVPDGEYRIRVVGSDHRFNPVDARTGEAVSESFVVDNTSPAFEGLKHRTDGDTIRVTGSARDAASDIVRLEHSLDGGDWESHPPVDGIFDSPTEELDVVIEAEAGREHSILFRATDLAGNLSTARVLVRP